MRNKPTMYRCLHKPIKWFERFGDVTETLHGPMIFQDNGAEVLGVAHLDTVKSNPKAWIGRTTISNCPQLDDRLGVWVLLNALPSRGLKFDLLLCDSEEVGQSTAQYFNAPRQYNWIFEFDRAGEDAVTYDFSTPAWDALLEGYGWKVEFGAFSDISALEFDIGCKGVNIGVGYHRQHTDSCWASLSQTKSAVDKFCRFYSEQYNVFMPHEHKEVYNTYSRHYPASRFNGYGGYGNCETVTSSKELCGYCGEDMYADRWVFCPYCGSPIPGRRMLYS